MIINRTIVILGICALFVLPHLALAAEIRLDASKVDVRVGEEFLIHVFMYSNEPVNAVEGSIVFPDTSLEVKEIHDGGSAVNFWIERPQVSQGTISFSGVTPGGFVGVNNLLFSIVLVGKREDTASVALIDTHALKHDGVGTELPVSYKNATIYIEPGDDSIRKEVMNDSELPEDFIPTIARDPNLFDGEYFLVFATQDKGSGIARYEIREGRWGWYTQAESLYLLAHQRLDRDIYVKAVDNMDNERIVVVSARVHSSWWERLGFPAILLVIVFLTIVYKKTWLKFIR